VQDESILITIRHHRFLIKHLFRISLLFSIFLHFVFMSGYFISKYWPGSTITIENGMELDHPDIDLDIPPELIGGDTTPAPVEKQEWIEGTRKNGEDHKEQEINTNQISGDGTDKDGFLYSFKGDKPPMPIIDFDLRQYFPAEAKSANIKTYGVTVLIQVDENGNLITVNIISGPAPYNFNEAAIKAVKRMRFTPGYKGGQRVKMAHQLPIQFTLEN
jgi:periplasmic protein TonB